MASGQGTALIEAEHMAAPTNTADVKKTLANSEPSTHGPSRHFAAARQYRWFRAEADIGFYE
jgi:hypothetical protein